MKEWGIYIALVFVVAVVVRTVYEVGRILGARLDELHQKVDVLQEKLEEIETNLETERIDKTYVNPIDIDRRV